MKSAVEDFRHANYRNEWTHKKKFLRDAGLTAYLMCRLDPERFILTLRLDRKNAIIFNNAILETKPDELIFAHRFKDITIEGEDVIVRNKFDKTIYSLNLGSLS